MKKCPYCAEEIQDEAVVCRYCGRDLRTGAGPTTQPQAIPVAQPVNVSVVQPKQTPWLAIVIVGVLGCFGAICCFFMAPAVMQGVFATQTAAARSDRAAVAGTATRGPGPTPAAVDTALGLSLTEFVSHYEDLTELQRTDFLEGLPGKTVDWTGKVYDVTDDGIMIDMPGSIWNGYALLKDVPADIAIAVKKDSRIHFTATIEGTTDFLFFYIDLVNVAIVDD